MFWDEETKTRQRIVIETEYTKVRVFNWDKLLMSISFILITILLFSNKENGSSRNEYYPIHTDDYQPIEQESKIK